MGSPFNGELVSLVVLHSFTGDYPWNAVHRQDIPKWLAEPEIMNKLVEGQTCQRGDSGWFRVEKLN